MNKSCFEKIQSITMDLQKVKYWQLTQIQIENNKLISKTRAIIKNQQPGLVTLAVIEFRKNYYLSLLYKRDYIQWELQRRSDQIADEILVRDFYPLISTR